MQHSGWIPHNVSTALPGTVVVLDTETEPLPEASTASREFHVLRFGIAKAFRLEKGKPTRHKRVEFTDKESFWLWLSAQINVRRVTWVFAHNITFDLTVLGFWELLDRDQYTLGPIRKNWTDKKTGKRKKTRWQGFLVDNDPPVIVQVKHKSGAIVNFVDTFNYWRKSLSEIGSDVNLPKLDRPPKGMSKAALRKYCERDVDILVEALTRMFTFCRNNDIGMFRYTIASQAFAAWRHIKSHAMVNVDRPDAVKALERRSYYGARCELLYVGSVDMPLWELDVQSMYPSIMRGNPFPRRLFNSWLDGGPFVARMPEPGLCTIAEVLVNSPNVPFPVRTAHGVYWATGRFWTTLCGPELKRAWDDGLVIEVAQWSSYKMGRLFDDYVDKFWKLRTDYGSSNQSLEEGMSKDLLTNLHGKFGQLTPLWELFDDFQPSIRWGTERHRREDTGESITIRCIAGQAFRMADRIDHKHSFCAISAYVCAYARERLRQLVKIAGQGHVYYVVADALYVDMFGKASLEAAGEVSEGKLGKLRIKSSGDTSEFNAVHQYRIGSKRVRGGIKHGAVDVGDDQFIETVFERLAQIISRPPRNGVMISQRARLNRPTPKRVVVGEDGWTKPVSVQADLLHDLWRMRDRYHPPELQELGTWISTN